ncbi:hypothetical protein INR49_018316 [Caranx melampygus]|nr:hypothetical protein INR49_018316 [Caranx melampygus]
MVPRGAFTVPLLLLCAVSAITVPPPENVTLSCDNLKTTVSWDYRDREPGTSFIGATAETSDLHFDLTSFVWESPQHYTAFHSVNVTAVRQHRKSKPVKSNSLSFSKNKKAHVNCLLDFPPVNLTVDKSGRTIRFENPLSFYSELRQAVNETDVSFEFSVSSNSPICRYDLPDECVLLDGRLDGKKTFPVYFRRTESVCPTYPPSE